MEQNGASVPIGNQPVNYQVPTTIFTIGSIEARSDAAHELDAADASVISKIAGVVVGGQNDLITQPTRDVEASDAWEAMKRRIDDGFAMNKQPRGDAIQQLENSADWIRLNKISERHAHAARFQAVEKLYRVQIDGDMLKMLSLQSSSAILFGLVSSVSEAMLGSVQDDDLICIRWTQPTVLSKSLFIAPTTKRLFDLEKCWAQFERCLASHEGFRLNADFSLSVFSLKRASTSDHLIPSVMHLREATASGDGASSSYLQILNHQRPQLSSIVHYPLKARAKQLIGRCKSMIDASNTLLSKKIEEIDKMKADYRMRLYQECEKQAKSRNHHKHRKSPRGGTQFAKDVVKFYPIRHVVKYNRVDCIPRALAVGTAHAMVFTHAAQLAERLCRAEEERMTKCIRTVDHDAVVKDTLRFISVLKDNALPGIKATPGTDQYTNFVDNCRLNMRHVAKQVLRAILHSAAFDLAYQSLLANNPPLGGNGLFELRQIDKMVKSIQDRMRRAIASGFAKINLTSSWPFVIPGMALSALKVSVYSFDGIRIDGTAHIVMPERTIHVQLLRSWKHMWILTEGTSQLRSKCPTVVKRCDICYDHVNERSLVSHTCSMACSRCKRASCEGRLWKKPSDEPVGVNHVTCGDCNREFIVGECYESHKWATFDLTTSLCQLLQICRVCDKRIDRSNKSQRHMCGMIHCSICGKYFAKNTIHKCFLQPLKQHNKDVSLSKSIPLAFDCETVVDETGAMIPVVIVVGQYNGEVSAIVKEFCGYGCFDQMAAWLIESVENSILVAHNGSRFDTLFLADALFRHGVETNTVRDGTGAMIQLTIPTLGVRVTDSCRLSPSSLNQFFNAYVPKGLRETLNLEGKDFFPYGLLTKANYDAHYIEQPMLSDFQPGEKMGEKEKTRLVAYYNASFRDRLDADGDSPTYDLHEQLLSYCQSDVRLLAMGVHYFRDACLNFAFNTDPLTEASTVASLAMRVWRKQFLEEDSVAVFTETNGKPSSYEADMCLRWTKESAVPDLQFKACGGEKKVIGGDGCYRYLDGYSAATQRAYEFLGCFWHGCPTCYPNNRDAMVPRLGKSFAAAYEEVAHRRYTILRLNPSTVRSFTEIWEHEWCNQVKNNTETTFVAFVEKFKDDHPPPIVERDALFGGRTEVFRTIYQYCNGECVDRAKCGRVHSDEVVVYLDVTSMYPYACCQRLPTGHGETLCPTSLEAIFVRKNEGGWTLKSEYEYSLIKMRIFAPGGLFLPVLPVRSGKDKRVEYATCSTCMDICATAPCRHTQEERAFDGTWSSLEISKALSLGYVPIRVYHVKYWKHSETSDQVLKSYVLHFFKQKLQYSGVDKDFARRLRLSNPTVSDADIESAFIEEIRVLSIRDFGEEIVLESGIVKDEPRRALAELFLNSLWGKLAQRTRLPMVSVFDNADDVFALIENGQWDFTSITFGYTHSKHSPTIDDLEEIRQERLTALDMPPNAIVVKYTKKEDFIVGSPLSNVHMAIFVTARARLLLYDILHKCQHRVLYCDTDSAFVTASAAVDLAEHLKEPYWLGQLKSETDNDPVVKFTAIGAKSYMYQTESGAETRHLKGFRMTNDTHKSITFESLAGLVGRSEDNPKITISQRTINRDAIHINLLRQKQMDKSIRNTHTKRIVPYGCRLSFPYGWTGPFNTVDYTGNMVHMSE